VVNATPRPLYSRQTHVYRRQGGTVGENLVTKLDWISPDRPARSESLYGLNYPDPSFYNFIFCGFGGGGWRSWVRNAILKRESVYCDEIRQEGLGVNFTPKSCDVIYGRPQTLIFLLAPRTADRVQTQL